MRPLVPTMLLSLLFACPHHAQAQKAPAASDAWPATRAGELAKGWVTSFNTGEAAMKEFLAARMAATTLAERSVPARVERYRSLREKYGRLQLDAVVKSKPHELTVKLLDADARSREFVFKSEPRAPFKLASVSIRERSGHGFGGFHH